MRALQGGFRSGGGAASTRLSLSDPGADHPADAAPRRDAVEPVDLRPHSRRALRGKGHASSHAGGALADAASADGDAASRLAQAHPNAHSSITVSGAPPDLLRHFRSAFAADPAEAYREWFRAQEELRDAEGEREAEIARALADDLWETLGDLPFPTGEVRARFLHNLGVFFGSPGPAADIERSRRVFLEAIELFEAAHDEAWLARAQHNFATSLSNLGTTAPDLEECLRLFDRALAWRTSEREIARGVTLHNRGLALRRLAELDPARAPEHLAESAAAFEEAAEIRKRHGLADGRARSLFHRGVTLLRLAGRGDPAPPARLEAARCLEQAAEIFDALGKTDSSEAARELAGAV